MPCVRACGVCVLMPCVYIPCRPDALCILTPCVSTDCLPPHVPQILINRETLRHLTFDVQLLGDCDIIINELCLRLHDTWTSACTSLTPAREIRHDEMLTIPTPPSKTDEKDVQSSSSNNASASAVVPSASTGFVASGCAKVPPRAGDASSADVVTSAADSSSGTSPSDPASEAASSRPPSIAAGLQGQ